jgi:hypothetical protein
MPDLHEELGRLADAVGEPVTFGELEVSRHRRERRRRSSSITVALVVVLAVGVFFGATYATLTTSPAVSDGPAASTQPSKHGPPPQGGAQRTIDQPRCLDGMRIIGNGSQLVTCAVWPSGTPVTVQFTIEGPARMKLALYPRLGCSGYGCDRAPLWRAKSFSGPGATTFRIPGLKFGRYVLIDRLHPATARTVILVG